MRYTCRRRVQRNAFRRPGVCQISGRANAIERPLLPPVPLPASEGNRKVLLLSGDGSSSRKSCNASCIGSLMRCFVLPTRKAIHLSPRPLFSSFPQPTHAAIPLPCNCAAARPLPVRLFRKLIRVLASQEAAQISTRARQIQDADKTLLPPCGLSVLSIERPAFRWASYRRNTRKAICRAGLCVWTPCSHK